MVVGKLRPRVTSLHTFLLMTSTRPPLAVTRRNNAYRSNTCLAMMGTRFTGVPGVKWVENQNTKIRPRLRSSQGTEGHLHEAWVRTKRRGRRKDRKLRQEISSVVLKGLEGKYLDFVGQRVPVTDT